MLQFPVRTGQLIGSPPQFTFGGFSFGDLLLQPSVGRFQFRCPPGDHFLQVLLVPSQLFLNLSLFGDVRTCSNPFADVAVVIGYGHPAHDQRPVLAVVTLNSVLGAVHGPRFDRMSPKFTDPLPVVRMKRVCPAPPQDLLFALSCELTPRRQIIYNLAICVGRPDYRRGGYGQRPVALFAFEQRLLGPQPVAGFLLQAANRFGQFGCSLANSLIERRVCRLQLLSRSLQGFAHAVESGGQIGQFLYAGDSGGMVKISLPYGFRVRTQPPQLANKRFAGHPSQRHRHDGHQQVQAAGDPQARITSDMAAATGRLAPATQPMFSIGTWAEMSRQLSPTAMCPSVPSRLQWRRRAADHFRPIFRVRLPWRRSRTPNRLVGRIAPELNCYCRAAAPSYGAGGCRP